MSREYKPGDVAMVSTPGIEDRLATWATRCYAPSHPDRPHWHIGDRNTYLPAHVAEAHPLAVLDPDAEPDMDRLANLIRKHHGRDVQVGLDWLSLQAALREFIEPEPPKCGAVLTFGATYVCIRDAGHEGPHYDDVCSWSHTEGVTTDD